MHKINFLTQNAVFQNAKQSNIRRDKTGFKKTDFFSAEIDTTRISENVGMFFKI